MLEWLRRQGCPVDAPSFFNTIAIALASHKVGPWMATHVPCQGELEHCGDGRLICPAQLGWCMPNEQMQKELEHAQACFCAFHGATRWLAKQRF